MFAWWGRVVVRARWFVLAATAALVTVGAVWGTGIFGALASGGFDDPASESSRAHARITEVFEESGDDLVIIYTHPSATADQSALAQPVQAVIADLEARPEVVEVGSVYDGQHPTFVSHDQHATYITVRMRMNDEDGKLADLAALEPLLVADGEVATEVGGIYAFLRDANNQVEADIVRAEIVSLPVLLVLLLFIFRGLVAAASPLLVGGVAILGGFVVTRAVASVTEVSVFAANVITLLGLGMAIDYALFVVGRFREELAAGHPTAVAVERTLRTAGRTVAVSGITVTLALSSLLLFPMGFLHSVAYGGMAAVLVAMLAALTSLPALLAVLGPRINALRIGPRPKPVADRARRGGWARLATSVMRRPVIYLVLVSAVLVGLGVPFLRAQFGGFDERVLPAGTPSRTVAERLVAEFPGGGTAPVIAVVDGASPQAADVLARRAAALPGVASAAVTLSSETVSVVSVLYQGTATSDTARELVHQVRDLPAPPGAQVLVGGRTASDIDQVDGLVGRLPWMGLYVFGVTFLLLLLAFGSMVLPVKAIVMNIISIGASFGVVVWVFQDGHLSDFMGFTSTGSLEPTNLVLLLAVLFGLSTDYEVFLLSRVREEYDRRLAAGGAQARENNTAAVAEGLQRTGGIITAAAVLLIVVVAGFTTGGTATMKMLGVGTVVAIAVDAALVRTLLVPATMRLLGRWNWWAPGPVIRLYQRVGLHESDDLPVPDGSSRREERTLGAGA